jgi:hypothetical protein
MASESQTFAIDSDKLVPKFFLPLKIVRLSVYLIRDKTMMMSTVPVDHKHHQQPDATRTSKTDQLVTSIEGIQLSVLRLEVCKG